MRDRRRSVITKLTKKLGKRKDTKLQGKKQIARRKGFVAQETQQESKEGSDATEGVSEKQFNLDSKTQLLSDAKAQLMGSTEEEEEEPRRWLDMDSSTCTAQEKLADAEKRLAEKIQAKKEKRLKFKHIIEENESQLKALSKQMQEVEEAIKIKEGKITEMKLERKEKPLFQKLGSQFSIAKSVLKKERLEDDLSVLKSQSASRRRQIQKYKTKIRYDLQILNDPSITAVKPANEPKLQQNARPIPQCFFVGAPTSTQQIATTTTDKQQAEKQQITLSDSSESIDKSSTTANWVKEQIAMANTYSADCSSANDGDKRHTKSCKGAGKAPDWAKEMASVRQKLNATWSLGSVSASGDNTVAIDQCDITSPGNGLVRQGEDGPDKGCGLFAGDVVDTSSPANACIGVQDLEDLGDEWNK